jgi:hypothetical protein
LDRDIVLIDQLGTGDSNPLNCKPTWGDYVAQYLKNSKHFVVPGAGYGSTTRGCVPQLILKLLDQASVRDLDPACLQSQRRPPFFLNYTGGDQP